MNTEGITPSEAEEPIGPEMPVDDPLAPVFSSEVSDALSAIDVSQVVNPDGSRGFGLWEATIVRAVGGATITIHAKFPWKTGGATVGFRDMYDQIAKGTYPGSQGLLEISTSYGCSFLYGSAIWKFAGYVKSSAGTGGMMTEYMSWGVSKPCMYKANYASIPNAPFIPTVKGLVQVDKDRWWTMVELDVLGELWSQYEVAVRDYVRTNKPDVAAECDATDPGAYDPETSNSICVYMWMRFDREEYTSWLLNKYSQWGVDISGVTYTQGNIAASCGGVWLPWAAPWGCLVEPIKYSTEFWYIPSPNVEGRALGSAYTWYDWKGVVGGVTFRSESTDLLGVASTMDIEAAEVGGNEAVVYCAKSCTPGSGGRAPAPICYTQSSGNVRCLPPIPHPVIHAWYGTGLWSGWHFVFGAYKDLDWMATNGGDPSWTSKSSPVVGFNGAGHLDQAFVGMFSKNKYWDPGEVSGGGEGERWVAWTDGEVAQIKDYVKRLPAIDAYMFLNSLPYLCLNYWEGMDVSWPSGYTNPAPGNCPASERISNFEKFRSSGDSTWLGAGDLSDTSVPSSLWMALKGYKVTLCPWLVLRLMGQGSIDYWMLAGKHVSFKDANQLHCSVNVWVCGKTMSDIKQYVPSQEIDNPEWMYPQCLGEEATPLNILGWMYPNQYPLAVFIGGFTLIHLQLPQNALLPIGYAGVAEIWLNDAWLIILVIGIIFLAVGILKRKRRKRY